MNDQPVDQIERLKVENARLLRQNQNLLKEQAHEESVRSELQRENARLAAANEFLYDELGQTVKLLGAVDAWCCDENAGEIDGDAVREELARLRAVMGEK